MIDVARSFYTDRWFIPPVKTADSCFRLCGITQSSVLFPVISRGTHSPNMSDSLHARKASFHNLHTFPRKLSPSTMKLATPRGSKKKRDGNCVAKCVRYNSFFLNIMSGTRRQWKTKLPPTRNYSIVFGFLGILGIALYPSIIHPMLFPDKYRAVQEDSRRGIRQEDIQPGNMRIWRDPFDRDKN